jgi:YfiH family protein
MRWREIDGIRWLEAELPGARAAFSTRLGGASSGAFESLNLGLLTDDDRECVIENRRLLCAALGMEPDRVVTGLQVHGAGISKHDGPQRPSPFAHPGSLNPDADGHVLTGDGLAGLVYVADCLPIALAGPAGTAILHCGWRGLAAGIVGRGATAVGAQAAAIGPGIGPCCYQVGDEVLAEFEPLGPGVASGRMLDLAEVARRLFAEAGVAEVESAGLCTSCNADLFFSHRRDGGVTGRQAGLAFRAAGEG